MGKLKTMVGKRIFFSALGVEFYQTNVCPPCPRGDGEGRGKFSWSKVGGMFFSRNEIAIRPRENAFPGPAVALDGPGSNDFE